MPAKLQLLAYLWLIQKKLTWIKWPTVTHVHACWNSIVFFLTSEGSWSTWLSSIENMWQCWVCDDSLLIRSCRGPGEEWWHRWRGRLAPAGQRQWRDSPGIWRRCLEREGGEGRGGREGEEEREGNMLGGVETNTVLHKHTSKQHTCKSSPKDVARPILCTVSIWTAPSSWQARQKVPLSLSRRALNLLEWCRSSMHLLLALYIHVWPSTLVVPYLYQKSLGKIVMDSLLTRPVHIHRLTWSAFWLWPFDLHLGPAGYAWVISPSPNSFTHAKQRG